MKALQWYASRLDAARQTAALTAAFGVNPLLAAVLSQDKDFPRFLLLEKRGENYAVYGADPDVQISVGSRLGPDPLYQWAAEKLTGFNVNVQFIHNKFLLVDPLGADPLVVTGSANFSEASTTENDENMLVIRGDTRVADIYLGEFMRMFNHFFFRYQANRVRSLPKLSSKEMFPPEFSWRRTTPGRSATTIQKSPKFKIGVVANGYQRTSVYGIIKRNPLNPYSETIFMLMCATCTAKLIIKINWITLQVYYLEAIMASKVYWGSPRQSKLDAKETLPAKLDLILDELHLRERVKDELVVLKMHTGSNIGYSTIHPVFVRKVVKPSKTAAEKQWWPTSIGMCNGAHSARLHRRDAGLPDLPDLGAVG